MPSCGDRTPSFHSLLFDQPADQCEDDTRQAPAFFDDLNCDQIVDAITADREEYNLRPFFHMPLSNNGTIAYRHEVLQDLECSPLYDLVASFASRMREVRGHIVQVRKMHYQQQKEAWFLDGVETYCELIKSFAGDLSGLTLTSRGFCAFRAYLGAYSRSSRLNTVLTDAKRIKSDLAAIEYCVLVRGNAFTVRNYEAEADYSTDVSRTFEKFRQGAATDYRVAFSANLEMNHVEAKILEFVAKLHPDAFQILSKFCAENADFIDPGVATFDREVQFYLAYLDYIAPLRRAGLAFCYPAVSTDNYEVYDFDCFDIALAQKLVKDSAPVVTNDFHMKGMERILVVSGPNQGGKTTFARAFGQLHYLANVGLLVPGREAKLFLFDQMFTHFEKEEKVENLRGKLEDDLLRIRDILEQATPRSIVIMNEVFTSTTIQDETFLSERVMAQIVKLDLLCVWVTFVDALASFGPQVVSMVSTVLPDNPALRTFKIVRRAADGLAYAQAIAEKYGLTYDRIRKRIGS